MKNFIRAASMFLLLMAFEPQVFVLAQSSGKDSKLIEDCIASKAAFIKADAGMEALFNKSVGYVIFPNIGKGAIGVGGASGNGILFEQGKSVGKAGMKQVTVGFQFGGQSYREVIFFEDKNSLDKFKQNKVEFSAQVSAIAAASGASANAKYKHGVLVFTQGKGGLMYEASVGGQKFSYKKY